MLSSCESSFPVQSDASCAWTSPRRQFGTSLYRATRLDSTPNPIYLALPTYLLPFPQLFSRNG